MPAASTGDTAGESGDVPLLALGLVSLEQFEALLQSLDRVRHIARS